MARGHSGVRPELGGALLANAGVMPRIPAKGKSVRHHIGNQPARVAGLERLDVRHDQAHTRTRRHCRVQGTQAVARNQAATGAALPAWTATGEKGFGAARQARGAQAGDGVGHASIQKTVEINA